MQLLKEGNQQFVTEAPFHGDVTAGRRQTIAKGQSPFAILVSCSDSRVSPELLFGRGLGDLFVVRVAGNSVDPLTLGSIEYGVAELGVPLVLVMGHERCGAIAAAVTVVKENATFPGAIGQVVEPLLPAVLQARDEPGDLVHNAVRDNVLRVVMQLCDGGTVLPGKVQSNKIKVLGAVYDLDTGIVDFMESA